MDVNSQASWMKLFAAISIATFSAISFADDGCNLERPPRAAVADAGHGFYVFIYPQTVPSKYNGCQTMWDERGRKQFSITFRRGQVVEYIGHDYSSDSKLISTQNCIYKKETLISSNADCPSYSSLRNGILTVPGLSEELKIPAERDPRAPK